MKRYLILIILLIGLFLRLYGIKWGLPDKEHFYSYYPDEYNTIHTLQTVNPGKLDFTPPVPMGNPTFFYFLVGFFAKAASLPGLLTLTQSKQFYLYHPEEYAKIYLTGRILAAIMGVLTVYLVYLIGKKFYSEKTGLLAGALFSIVPLNVVCSHYMEPGVAVTFWLTLTMFFCLSIIYTGTQKWYILSGISLGLAIGSKYTAIPFGSIVLLAHLLNCYKPGISLKDISKKLLDKKIFLFLLMTVIFFIIGVPYSVLDIPTFKYNMSVFFDAATKGTGSCFKINWLYPITNILYYSIGPFILVLAVGGVIFAVIKREKADLLLLAWILLYYYIQAQSGYKIARYQNEYLPFLIILAARFIFYFKDRIGKYAVNTIIVLSILITSIYTLSYTNMMTKPSPQDTASLWIKDNIPQGSKIGVIRKPYYYSPPVINMKYYALSRYQENPEYNKPGYKITDLDYTPAKLDKEKPEYIVTSEFEYLHNLPPGPDTEAFIDKIFSSGKYKEIKRFELSPSFLMFSFDKKVSWPLDWKMPCATILILKRTK
ncbi:MAG: glycosyltransferase family 39 protein [Elusimicrobia bacterium]|nr:glycosyltransferase family 39 protein [Elusimicrobiota bacterium]